MSASMIGARCSRVVRRIRRPMSTNAAGSTAVVYPEIKDISPRGLYEEKYAKWHKKIQKLGTVEEKLIEINMPRYYGWKCHMVHEGDMPYNGLPLQQHITKTHLVEGLPAMYNSNEAEEAANQLANELKLELEEALLFEWNRKVEMDKDAFPWEKEVERAPRIIELMNSVLLSRLGKHCPHLKDVVADSNPRLEAGWSVGGMNIPTSRKKSLESIDEKNEKLSWPYDRHFQYLGSPVVQLRAKQPLQPVFSKADSENSQLEIATHPLDPKVKGVPNERRYVTVIPGFWPGDDHKFGTISYHNSALPTKPGFFPEDKLENLHSQAILASFAWLFGQACYLGFSTFNDITYPLVSQTILSNGQTWSFYTYQLNTTVIQFDEKKSKSKNICWSSKPTQLFESIDAGKISGFNIEVVKNLVKFYLNEPKVRKGVNMTPFLAQDTPLAADLDHEERRIFLEELYKKLNLNGKKARPDPEYWNWEWIYKIKHKTRPQEARRRPFELWQNPWSERIDEQKKVYVPKPLREDPKQKYKKTYFP